MKFRSDFATNSSSSSFILHGFYSKEMLKYLKVLIKSGFAYRRNGMDTMSAKGWLATQESEAVVDALTYIPHGKNQPDKVGFQIEMQDGPSAEYEPLDAIMAFINPQKVTTEQWQELKQNWESLLDDAEKKGQVFFDTGKYHTDASDFAGHYTIEDLDNINYTMDGPRKIIGCKNKNIQEATIRIGNVKIGVEAFREMPNLKKVTTDGCGFDIMGKAFLGCKKLESVIGYPSSIGVQAFSGCTGFKEIDLTRCGKIGARAFENCSALEQITLNSYVQIGKQAFKKCSALKEAIFPGRSMLESSSSHIFTVQIADDAFVGCENLTIVGCIGSDAVKFAKAHNIPYRILTSQNDESTQELPDVPENKCIPLEEMEVYQIVQHPEYAHRAKCFFEKVSSYISHSISHIRLFYKLLTI
jgi:hypothetical protein